MSLQDSVNFWSGKITIVNLCTDFVREMFGIVLDRAGEIKVSYSFKLIKSKKYKYFYIAKTGWAMASNGQRYPMTTLQERLLHGHKHVWIKIEVVKEPS